MISFQNTSKIFGHVHALKPFSLELANGQTHVLLGTSGSGKSTVLRLLCGLIEPSGGTVSVDGRVVSFRNQRELALQNGYVIQEGGLFPHLNARRNIALAAHPQGWPEEKINTRIKELCRLVQLDESFLDHYPSKLSGGQRQRVALMRALLLDPHLLLLDEPLGALDPLVRSELQTELKRIFNTVKKTVVMVTHDVMEAAYFGHTLSLFHHGELVQHGTFRDFIKKPASEFVQKFIRSQIPSDSFMEELR